jgi:hypothetical protein
MKTCFIHKSYRILNKIMASVPHNNIMSSLLEDGCVGKDVKK